MLSDRTTAVEVYEYRGGRFGIVERYPDPPSEQTRLRPTEEQGCPWG